MLSINKKHKNTNGFNLIELMIVIVILASLIAFAVVKYNSYSKRAGITTAANYMEGMKAKVTLYFVNHNDTAPDDMSSQINIGLLDSNTKKYISNISYRKGSSELPNNITININNGAVLAYIVADLTPSIATSNSTPSKIYYVASIGNSASSEVSWSCYAQGLDTNSIPQSCETTGTGSGGCGGTTRWSGSSCIPCLTGATCSGGSITVCPSGLYGSNCTNTVSSCSGYVNGTGEQATCITPCPSTANCSGGAITSCNSGYYGDGCGTQCLGALSGSEPNATCTICTSATPLWNGTSCVACPTNAVCNNGTINDCSPGYYGSNCSTTCLGTLSGTGPNATCTPCSGSTPYWNGTSCVACPANAVCNNGTITNCNPGYYGSNCSTTCLGTLSGTGSNATCTTCSGSTPYWNGTSCVACPTNAVCNNGTITNCNPGYYGSNCSTTCSGTLSGTGPNATCAPCSGSTPYWNGSSCATCPAHAICSNGAISGCQSGYYWSFDHYCSSNCPTAPDNCNSECHSGYIALDWPYQFCVPCPSHALCTNGAITGCQTGYYATQCVNQCQGVLSGSWPNLTCTPCSGGTGWNGTNCVTCLNGQVAINGFCVNNPCVAPYFLSSNGTCQLCNQTELSYNLVTNTLVCHCPPGTDRWYYTDLIAFSRYYNIVCSIRCTIPQALLVTRNSDGTFNSSCVNSCPYTTYSDGYSYICGS